MAEQEDYILRHIAMLRQLLNQMLKLRSSGQHEQAMALMMQAQEKLFGRPPLEVIVLPLDDQLELLAKGISPEQAREKHVGYALLLREAGLSYAERDRNDLAASAFKAALYILLRVSMKDGRRDEALVDLIRSTLASTPAEQVDAPIREMLSAITQL
jgi:hypothetical protein